MSHTNSQNIPFTGLSINNRGDVVKLISFDGCRAYTLYKIEQHDTETWTYMLFIDNDFFPIVISEELAKSIIANPSIGGEIAYKTWLERHQ